MIKYNYWFPFTKKPKKLPKMCQFFALDKFEDENNPPLLWGTRVRRWPVNTRPRKSRDRRLLEALLKCLDVKDCGYKCLLCEPTSGEFLYGITQSQEAQLIAIKQSTKARAQK